MKTNNRRKNKLNIQFFEEKARFTNIVLTSKANNSYTNERKKSQKEISKVVELNLMLIREEYFIRFFAIRAKDLSFANVELVDIKVLVFQDHLKSEEHKKLHWTKLNGTKKME
jgi:histidinol phosphatase-like enzyme